MVPVSSLCAVNEYIFCQQFGFGFGVASRRSLCKLYLHTVAEWFVLTSCSLYWFRKFFKKLANDVSRLFTKCSTTYTIMIVLSSGICGISHPLSGVSYPRSRISNPSPESPGPTTPREPQSSTELASQQPSPKQGRLDSVEWNGGMEWWNGTVEWNSEVTTPTERARAVPDDLYPISDNGLVRSRLI